MKTIFIPAKSRARLNKEKVVGLTKKLPKNLAITYSIQFKDIATEIKNVLKDKNITSFTQVLGCSKPVFKNTDAILLIGSGKFHGISLAYNTKLPVYILNRDTLNIVSKQDIEIIEKKQRALYLRYLNSNKVGIIVSTKPGQSKLKTALAFKKDSDKKTYVFLTNNINSNEFENFRVDSWINTACPRLDMDSNIINIDKLLQN